MSHDLLRFIKKIEMKKLGNQDSEVTKVVIEHQNGERPSETAL